MTRPHTTRSRLAGLGLAGTLAVAGCSGGGADRADVVAEMTTQSVPARYSTFADAASALEVSVGEWCESGDAAAVTGQVDATRNAWVSVQPFWFGPVMDRRSRFIVDPVVTRDDVQEILDAGGPVDAAALRDLYGADQRGLAVVEELVDMTDGSVPSAAACDYADASSALVAEEAAALTTAWRDEGPGFGADDEAANVALGGMVNEILFSLGRLKADPEATGPGVAAAEVDAMRWAILGDPTASTGNVEGITELLDDDVVDQLRSEFDDADSLDPEAIMALERTVATNVVSSLGLSVQFSDADGDG